MDQYYDPEVMVQNVNQVDDYSIVDPPMMIKLQISNVNLKVFNHTKFQMEIDTFLVFRLDS